MPFLIYLLLEETLPIINSQSKMLISQNLHMGVCRGKFGSFISYYKYKFMSWVYSQHWATTLPSKIFFKADLLSIVCVTNMVQYSFSKFNCFSFSVKIIHVVRKGNKISFLVPLPGHHYKNQGFHIYRYI